MISRLVLRCSVYDGDRPVEIKEQVMTRSELPVALRRVHFNTSFVAAIENGYRIVFEQREA